MLSIKTLLELFFTVILVLLIVILKLLNDLKNLLSNILVTVKPLNIDLTSSKVNEFLGTPLNTENSFLIPSSIR